MPLTIRLIEAHEAAAVGDLIEAAYDAGGQFDADDGYRQEVRDVAKRISANEVLVAVEGDAVVGTVTLIGPDSPHAEISRPGEYEFRFLAVAPSAWGRGVGDALVRVCCDRADTRRVDLVLMTRNTNSAAHHLYERNGFSRLPERDWEPAPGVELIAFRRLAPHNRTQQPS